MDVGTVRVGVAMCDPDGILASPLKTLSRDLKKNSDVRVLVKHVIEQGAVQVFVGLPRTMKGEERGSAQMAVEYAELLADDFPARLRLVAMLDGRPDRLPAPEADAVFGLPLVHLDPAAPSAPERVALALDCATGRVAQVAGAFAA
ncbi:MAG: RuvX/YqgF family protein [Rhodospirillales bacterium]|nr:RuvX/YqgF family protein [Rhodospirillales bacterium]